MKAITVKLFLILVTSVTCDRITNYKQVGQTFVQKYYALFDNILFRAGVKDFYDSSDSILVSGTDIFFGSDKIMERLNVVSSVVQRNVTATDCQPTNDAGVIMNVFGKILSSDTTSNWTPFFTEMFVIKPKVTSYYIQSQYFRSTVIFNSTTNMSINIIDGLRFV